MAVDAGSSLWGRKVLVVRPGALGDTILALPGMRALRAAVGPGGRVEVVGYTAYLELARNHLHAHAIHSIDRGLFSGLFSEPVSKELLEFLDEYDVLVAWCHRLAALLETRFRRAGRACVRASPVPIPGSGCHVAEHLTRTLEPLGLRAPVDLPTIAPADGATERAGRLLAEVGWAERPYTVVHPGSGDPMKNWPSERFREILRLARRDGCPPLVLQGPADEEAALALGKDRSLRVARLVEPRLGVLAELLRGARLYIGNDSGVTHLAAAVGAPTIALFGATDPSIWGPRGPQVRVLSQGRTAREVWSHARALLAVANSPLQTIARP